MSRRIGKRVREDAIHCLEQCASDLLGGFRLSVTSDVYELYSDAQILARESWAAARRHVDGPLFVVYLEAVALLRDGWSPGEPLVLL